MQRLRTKSPEKYGYRQLLLCVEDYRQGIWIFAEHWMATDVIYLNLDLCAITIDVCIEKSIYSVFS